MRCVRTMDAMTHRLYLVEDHPVMREAYAHVLAGQSDLSLCGEAETGEQALVDLDTLAGGCDLVVTDMRLPGMSGLDLIIQIHNRWPHLPVMVITGHEDSLFERRATEAGAVAFLPKRLAASRLLDTIRGVLKAES